MRRKVLVCMVLLCLVLGMVPSITLTATSDSLIPKYMSGVFKSESFEPNNHLTVPVGSTVDTMITLQGDSNMIGTLKVEIREDFSGLYPDISHKTIIKRINGINNKEEFNAGSFVASKLTTGAFREYFYRVYWNDKLIYNPEDPDEREWVKTTSITPYLHILTDEIEDKNPNRAGIQGIVEIPFEYYLPPLLEQDYGYFCTVKINDEFMGSMDDAKIDPEPWYLARGVKARGLFKIASHLFENGDTIVEIGAQNVRPPKVFYSDEVSLDFQNEAVVNKEEFESEYSEGILDFHPEVSRSELQKDFEQIYQKLQDFGYSEDEIKGAELEFTGDIEKHKYEIIKVANTASTIKWGIGCVGVGWTAGPAGIAACIKGFAVAYVVFFVAEVASEATEPSMHLKYSQAPVGDLEGNVYAVHAVTESVEKDYVNALYRIKAIHPFFLNIGGEWVRAFGVGAENLYEWKGTWENCVEWDKPTTIKEGETKSFKLKIKKDVLPNLNTGSMRLELEIPEGLEISNLGVKDADDYELKEQNFVRVDTEYTADRTGYFYILSNKPSVKGEEKPSFLPCTRVIINIHTAWATTKEEITFDIKAISEGPFEVNYGVIPGERTAGEYGRVRCDEREYPNPITYKQPTLVNYYWYRTLKNSIQIDSPPIDEDIFPPEIDIDALFASISDFFEVIISTLNEIVLTLQQKTISVPPEEKAKENVEDALSALAGMAEAYYGFMELIYELSEVEPPEGTEVEFNYQVLSSKFCNNIAEAQTYMSSSGIKSADMNEALNLVRELELEKNGFCIVIVDYSFMGFGEYESGNYPIVCNEKGDPFWDSWQFYEMIKGEIEAGYNEN